MPVTAQRNQVRTGCVLNLIKRGHCKSLQSLWGAASVLGGPWCQRGGWGASLRWCCHFSFSLQLSLAFRLFEGAKAVKVYTSRRNVLESVAPTSCVCDMPRSRALWSLKPTSFLLLGTAYIRDLHRSPSREPSRLR